MFILALALYPKIIREECNNTTNKIICKSKIEGKKINELV